MSLAADLAESRVCRSVRVTDKSMSFSCLASPFILSKLWYKRRRGKRPSSLEPGQLALLQHCMRHNEIMMWKSTSWEAVRFGTSLSISILVRKGFSNFQRRSHNNPWAILPQSPCFSSPNHELIKASAVRLKVQQTPRFYGTRTISPNLKLVLQAIFIFTSYTAFFSFITGCFTSLHLLPWNRNMSRDSFNPYVLT